MIIILELKGMVVFNLFCICFLVVGGKFCWGIIVVKIVFCLGLDFILIYLLWSFINCLVKVRLMLLVL